MVDVPGHDGELEKSETCLPVIENSILRLRQNMLQRFFWKCELVVGYEVSRSLRCIQLCRMIIMH